MNEEEETQEEEKKNNSDTSIRCLCWRKTNQQKQTPYIIRNTFCLHKEGLT